MSDVNKNKEIIEKANQKKAMKELLLKNQGAQKGFSQQSNQQKNQKGQKGQKALKRFIKPQ